MRTNGLVILAFLLFNFSKAQDKEAPEYLTIQEFPDSVINTRLITIKGQPTTLAKVLKKHKGKRVLVDFWASWCKDCIAAIPEYKYLMDRTEEAGFDVVYLPLSVDKEDNNWIAAIGRFDIEGHHYRFAEGWKNPFSNYVDLDWIPRYIILDEKGKIIEPKSVHIGDESNYQKLIGATN